MVELSEEDKAAEANRLRTELGATYQSIANRLGYASKTAARQAVLAARGQGDDSATAQSDPDPDTGDDEGEDEGTPQSPAASAAKQAWVDYVVEHHGLTEEVAKESTRDQLAEQYGSA